MATVYGKYHHNRNGGQRWTRSEYVTPETPGTVVYVSSAAGGATNDGFSPETALTTINLALAKLAVLPSGDTAATDNGNEIRLLPGHVETITAAQGVLLNQDGLTVLGLGTGRQRARINYTTAATASFDITADRVCVRNVTFTPTGFDAVAEPVKVTAGDDCTIEDCSFELASASAQATLGILTSSGTNRLTVRRCRFHGSADAGTATAIRVVGGDAHLIEDNTFVGNYTTTLGAIENNTTAWTNAMILRNAIYNRTASSTKAVVCVTGATGVIAWNVMQILSGTAPITGDAMAWLDNTYSAVIATAGSVS